MPEWSITAMSSGRSRLTRCLVRRPRRTGPVNSSTRSCPFAEADGFRTREVVLAPAMNRTECTAQMSWQCTAARRAEVSLCGRQELLRVPSCPGVGRVRAQHPAELLHHLAVLEPLDRGAGQIAAGLLLDP